LMGYGGDRVRWHDGLGKAYGNSLRPGWAPDEGALIFLYCFGI